MFAICKDLTYETGGRKLVSVSELCVINLNCMTYDKFVVPEDMEVNPLLDYGRIKDGSMIRYKILKLARSEDEARALVEGSRLSVPPHVKVGNEKIPLSHFLQNMERKEAKQNKNKPNKKKKSAPGKKSDALLAQQIIEQHESQTDPDDLNLENISTKRSDAILAQQIMVQQKDSSFSNVMSGKSSPILPESSRKRAGSNSSPTSMPKLSKHGEDLKLKEPSQGNHDWFAINQHSEPAPDTSHISAFQTGSPLYENIFSDSVDNCTQTDTLNSADKSVQTEMDSSTNSRLDKIEETLQSILKSLNKGRKNTGSQRAENISNSDGNSCGQEQQQDEEHDENYVNCGNNIYLSKKVVERALESSKSLQAVVSALLNLMFPEDLHKYYLAPKEGQDKFPEACIRGVENVILSHFTNEVQDEVDRKIRRFKKYCLSKDISKEEFLEGCDDIRDKMVNNCPFLNVNTQDIRNCVTHALYNKRTSMNPSKRKQGNKKNQASSSIAAADEVLIHQTETPDDSLVSQSQSDI